MAPSSTPRFAERSRPLGAHVRIGRKDLKLLASHFHVDVRRHENDVVDLERLDRLEAGGDGLDPELADGVEQHRRSAAVGQ